MDRTTLERLMVRLALYPCKAGDELVWPELYYGGKMAHFLAADSKRPHTICGNEVDLSRKANREARRPWVSPSMVMCKKCESQVKNLNIDTARRQRAKIPAEQVDERILKDLEIDFYPLPHGRVLAHSLSHIHHPTIHDRLQRANKRRYIKPLRIVSVYGSKLSEGGELWEVSVPSLGKHKAQLWKITPEEWAEFLAYSKIAIKHPPFRRCLAITGRDSFDFCPLPDGHDGPHNTVDTEVRGEKAYALAIEWVDGGELVVTREERLDEESEKHYVKAAAKDDLVAYIKTLAARYGLTDYEMIDVVEDSKPKPRAPIPLLWQF